MSVELVHSVEVRTTVQMPIYSKAIASQTRKTANLEHPGAFYKQIMKVHKVFNAWLRLLTSAFYIFIYVYILQQLILLCTLIRSNLWLPEIKSVPTSYHDTC